LTVSLFLNYDTTQFQKYASQRMDSTLSSKSRFPGLLGDIECGIVRPVSTVKGDFLGDAEALLAARLFERVSSDEIAPT
jgi:hypothetical protein